jgi:hypothetical protein
VSPVVRAVLSAISDEIVITDEDWVEVIDPSEWRERDGRDNDEHHVTVGPMDTRPIIGRHSRPDSKKWPADADEIRQAYPINGEVRVRVLGGAEAVVETLGAVPAAWEVLPYGSLPAAEFLAGLDAYVYFHHRDLTEAFGRSILEALAARVPVVVAPHFEPLFGEACLYASPSTASDTVRALLADPDELQRHLDRADEIVATRFSHAVHQTRLARMAGPPGELFGDSKRSDSPAGRAAPAFALIPAAQRRAHTTTLIACLGAPLERVESLLGQLDKHRRRAPGFIPILVVTLSVPPLARELGLETRVITSRRNFSSDTEDWDDYAVGRLRQLAMHYRVDNVAAAGFDDADAWIALQCRRRDARVDP